MMGEIIRNEKGHFVKGANSSWNKGMKMDKPFGFALHGKTTNTGRTRFKKGEPSLAFKGDKVGKSALHDWVKARLGTPMKCEQCGFESDNPCQINWANKSGEYKRDLSDWLRLCRKCHHKYDNISEKMWKTRKSK
jgi:hypothetical protein